MFIFGPAAFGRGWPPVSARIGVFGANGDDVLVLLVSCHAPPSSFRFSYDAMRAQQTSGRVDGGMIAGLQLCRDAIKKVFLPCCSPFLFKRDARELRRGSVSHSSANYGQGVEAGGGRKVSHGVSYVVCATKKAFSPNVHTLTTIFQTHRPFRSITLIVG